MAIGTNSKDKIYQTCGSIKVKKKGYFCKNKCGSKNWIDHL